VSEEGRGDFGCLGGAALVRTAEGGLAWCRAGGGRDAVGLGLLAGADGMEAARRTDSDAPSSRADVS
jgi:hypothetical protein